MNWFLRVICFAAGIATRLCGEVTVTDFVLRDTTRNRTLECRSYTPTGAAKHPLILFSHGFGADRTAFGPIARRWAERGYVVIAPSHWDGSGQSKGKGDPVPTGGLSALRDHAARKTEQRVRDLTFLLDAADQLPTAVPALLGRIDPDRVGVAGHSLGAYTAMLLAGVTVTLGDGPPRSFRDPRIRCVLPISAQGPGQQGLTSTSWSALTLPLLTITGSLDRGAGGQGPEWKQQPFELSPPGDKFLVFIDGAHHGAFGGTGPAAVSGVVEAATGAFWDAYLKDSATAQAALQDASVLAPWAATARLAHK
jgi:predicted dienelactone hydrolase